MPPKKNAKDAAKGAPKGTAKTAVPAGTAPTQQTNTPPPPPSLPDITKSIIYSNQSCDTFTTDFDCNKNLTCFWGMTAAVAASDTPIATCNPRCKDNEYWDANNSQCSLFQ